MLFIFQEKEIAEFIPNETIFFLTRSKLNNFLDLLDVLEAQSED